MVERTPAFADDQLDRLAARSLAAAERSSAAQPPSPKRSLLPWIVTTGAVAFSLGLVANPWFESTVRSRLPGQLQNPSAGADPVVAGRVDALEGRVAQLESAPASPPAANPVPLPGGLVERIADLEADAERLAAADLGVAARIDQLASTAGSSVAGQSQVRELFLLSVARRSIEAGRPFGAYERILTQTFSTRDRSATEALAAWSAAPHSRAMLHARLQPPVSQPPVALPPQAGWWDRLMARLSGVVQVRTEDALAADSESTQRAADALADGDLPRAIAIFELVPQSRTRDLWLADARRLLAAEQALDTLEMVLLSAPVPDGPAATGSPVSPQPPLNAPGKDAPAAAVKTPAT